jgi:hypothetical protein
VKVIEPTPLMLEAASVLGPIIDDVVIIGAVAVAVALSLDHAAGVPAAELRRIVMHTMSCKCSPALVTPSSLRPLPTSPSEPDGPGRGAA